MAEELEAQFNFSKYEDELWKHWNSGNWFHADEESEKQPYVILIPPPNVTDRLHMGHGLNNTIQDILIRWKRMSGFNCLWLPGTDHAGIATQMMVEKSLISEGLTRKDIGRNEFFQRCMHWKDKNGNIIIDQLKRLGASCDWQRQAYTMDEKLSKAVREIFVRLFNDGLIYRGERLVNWDPVLETAISDDEVVNQEETGALWYYSYPIEGTTDKITIATTRPETMFGDTAVAVHPDDDRYKKFIGKMVELPLTDRKIPIIADEYVKSEYGSGCVKITPAHDPNDFMVGKRHQLSSIIIFTPDAKLSENCPRDYIGLDRFEARKKIIREMKEKDLFVKEEKHKHKVPYSDRSKVPIEPMLSKQWFLKMEELAKPALKYAEKGELKFYPDSWKKTYDHWLEGIQDWCISRQLWWGHQIPIWYCQDCGEVLTGVEDPTSCISCGSENLEREQDVLDTWFSSWLWPLSPFGWPESSTELGKFFPSQVLVTGADIIFLWVARMVMVSDYAMKALPFKDVYFNSIICDKKGRKFSKTLGNGIDPLKVIDKFGADAVRYTCVSLAPLGGRVKMAESDFEVGHRFVNKLWNASRFLFGHFDHGWQPQKLSQCELDLPSSWLIHELNRATEDIENQLSQYLINEAVDTLFQFVWRSFCDWGLEAAKLTLHGEESAKSSTLSALVYVFEGLLRLAAPFIPFVSETIWSKLPQHPDWLRDKSLVITAFPSSVDIPKFPSEGKKWSVLQDLVSAIRSVRTQAQVPPKEKLTTYIQCEAEIQSIVEEGTPWIKLLSGVDNIYCGSDINRPEQSLVAVGKGFSAYVPVARYLDWEKEKMRLLNESKRIERIVFGLEKKLNNNNFTSRAPEEVVQQSRDQLENMRAQHQAITDNLNAFEKSV